MFREIKFKAWVKNFAAEKYEMIFWFPQFFSDISCVTGCGSDFPEPDDPDVILMQYTNIKDKNDTEDYIDDIVKTHIGQSVYYRRIFQAESGAYCINLPVIGSTGGEDAIMLITCEHENVGNFYENPGLLDKESEI